jgi:hypothetical protein
MKANEIKESPKVAQESHEGGEMQVGQLKATHDAPPAESPNTPQLRQLQAAADASPQVHQLRALQAAASNSPQVQQAAQLMQAASLFAGPAIQRKRNDTGLPDQLKSGIESLSGMAMDDVKVHYNSSQPAQLHAHAFAQGNDIHLAAGQEKHLAHEAWHVVQQRQGRVQPTTEVGGQAVNDNPALEREADVKGAEALQTKADPSKQLATAAIGGGSAQLVAQLLREGSANATTKNKETALEELDEIDSASDVNEAMESVETLAPGTLDRYKVEYTNPYLSNRGKDDSFQWPLTYLKQRGSRKSGRLVETPSIAAVYGEGVSKNNQAYDVTFTDLYGGGVKRTIPDIMTDKVVGDVKDVKYQSFTEQLEAIYAIAKGEDSRGGRVTIKEAGGSKALNLPERKFDLVVRGPKGSENATKLSSSLMAAVDTVYYHL